MARALRIEFEGGHVACEAMSAPIRHLPLNEIALSGMERSDWMGEVYRLHDVGGCYICWIRSRYGESVNQGEGWNARNKTWPLLFLKRDFNRQLI